MPLLDSPLVFLTLVLLMVAAAVFYYQRRRSHGADDQEVDVEERYRCLLESKALGCLETDRDGIIRRINRNECLFRGVTPQQLLGKPIWELEPESTRQRSREEFERKRGGVDQPVHFQRKYQRPDGSVAVVEVHERCFRDRRGWFMGVQAVSVDASGRDTAEEEVLRVTGELNAIFEAFPDSFVRLDSTGTVVSAKSGRNAAPGFLSDACVGKKFQNALPASAAASFARAMAEVLRSRSSVAVDFETTGENGTQYFEARLASINWNEIIVLLRSITQRKQAEERIHQYAQELELKNEELVDALVSAREATRLKTRFLANISHEIRTPINGVLGMAELLLDTKLDSEQREFGRAIRRSADALLKVVDDLLDLSKIEAGKLEMQRVSFDLRALIEEAVAAHTLLAGFKGLKLVCDIAPDVPRLVHGDPARLEQVLLNLLDNAVKFTEQGQVSLTAALGGRTRETCTLRVVVKDTGIGIAPQQLPKLFQSFVQGDGSTTRKYGGAGLGLVLSKRLVEMMGGEITVHSQPGQGSTFSFTALFDNQDTEGLPAGELPDALRDVRVLVVEHDDFNRAAVCRYLGFWGCRYQEVSSSQFMAQTLRHAALQGRRFQLALVAVDTSDEDGSSIVRAVQADPTIRDTILIALAGEPTPQTAGFAACVTRPTRPGDLYDTILENVKARDLSPEASLAALSRNQPVALKPTRVLVAEDDAVNREIVLRFLRRMGLNADVAVNGQQAVEAATTSQYDLVLMDVQMPAMDGLEATAAIRFKEGSSRRTPILALTAHALPGDRERCLDAGMDDYLSKPLTLEKLRQALCRWLGQEYERFSFEDRSLGI